MPPSASPLICSRCSSRLQWHRSFSTAPSHRSIAPESPRFITVPEALQVPKKLSRRPKGILPVPRTIFKPGKDSAKASEEALWNAAPEPKSATLPTGDDAARLAWKQRMAESRRTNLRAGVRELLQRKRTHDRAVSVRGANKQDRHERLANKPIREDERLTTPTTHNSVRRILNREVPTSSRRSRPGNKFEKREAQKSDERKDMLHTLYTHARSFIVSEKAMNEALDKAFGTDEHPVYWNTNGNSIWATGQQPAGIKEMLNMDNVTTDQRARNAISGGNTTVVETVVQKRMRRIAEELTGGRIR